MSELRAGIVLGVVAGKTQEQAVRRVPLDRTAEAQYVLVVLLGAQRQIIAITVASECGDRAADAEAVGQGYRAGNQPIQLAVVTGRTAHLQHRVGVDPARHVLDGATDRVAAVKRTLRAAQHLDAIDFVQVENGRVRPVEVDVVDVEAHARFEAGDRILLADAADEGRQRRIRAARHFQRHVRALLGDLDDIDRAHALEIDTADHGNRQRNFHQRFLATSRRRHDDFVDGLVRACLRMRRPGNREQRQGRCRKAGADDGSCPAIRIDGNGGVFEHISPLGARCICEVSHYSVAPARRQSRRALY